jgi:hypothetical protein
VQQGFHVVASPIPELVPVTVAIRSCALAGITETTLIDMLNFSCAPQRLIQLNRSGFDAASFCEEDADHHEALSPAWGGKALQPIADVRQRFLDGRSRSRVLPVAG